MTRYRCPFCKGNIIFEDNMLTCIMCARVFKTPSAKKG